MRYWKLTNSEEKSYGYKFITGLNTDPIPFVGKTGVGGGFHFFDEAQLISWPYSISDIKFIRAVTIPDDAQLYVDTYNCKADKIILSEPEVFDEINIGKYINLTGSIVFRSCSIDGLIIKYINPNDHTTSDYNRLCSLAVSNNGDYLIYIDLNKCTIYDEVCMLACKQSGYYFKHINKYKCNNYYDIYLVAIKTTRESFNYIKDNFDGREEYSKLCLDSVKINGSILRYIDSSKVYCYDEICLQAVKQDWDAIRYIDLSHSKISAVVYYNICTTAIDIIDPIYKRKGYAISFISYIKLGYYRYLDLWLTTVKNNGSLIDCISIENLNKDDYSTVCLAAVKNNPQALKFVKVYRCNNYHLISKISQV